jgi:hypothetical protein
MSWFGQLMDFPCDQCKTIRSFSGEPPRCDVCGRLRDVPLLALADVPPASPDTLTPEHKIAIGTIMRLIFWGVLVVGIIFLGIQRFGPQVNSPGKPSAHLAPSQYQIALEYHLTEDQVLMDPKPQECDFTTAPVGNKHCHFEQSLNVVRECLDPKCPPARVYVGWRKVLD